MDTMVSIFIIILVGTAVSANENGWEIGKEYVYSINSQTLATLDEGNNQYTGIIFKGYLTIQPNSDDQLRAKITNALYAQIHKSFDDETKLEMKDDKLDFQKLPISESPFGINLQNGVIIDLFVNKSMPMWELNILRSIVSQMQVNVTGENIIRSERNVPQEDGPTTSFSAMEETVSGRCDVFYNITPLLGSMLDSYWRVIPMPQLQPNASAIVVKKTKNLNNCEQKKLYHFGFSKRNYFRKDENYFSRSSESRIVITGNLKHFVIQSSETRDKIHQRLNFLDNRRGKVLSRVTLTLEKYDKVKEPLEFVPESRSAGSLVYDSNTPSRNDTEKNKQDNSQPKTTMENAPNTPFLPYSFGSGERSLIDGKQDDLITAVTDLCRKIGTELQSNPSEMVEEETIEKITILTRLLRTMNVLELNTVHDNLNQSMIADGLNDVQRWALWNSLEIFRESVAQSGTAPALSVIRSWIQNRKLFWQEAAKVVSVLSKSARNPTPEFVQEFFKLIEMDETLNDKVLHRAAVLGFADILNKCYRYPVYQFGNFSIDADPIYNGYLDYLSAKLNEAVQRGSSADIQTFTSVIARVDNPKIITILGPHWENSSLTTFQRAWMVLSLTKFATARPYIAKSMLFKMYTNTNDSYEVRCAAAFVLMMANPLESVLKSMANFTNYDPDDHVGSAVKAFITSAADLDDDSELNRGAKLAAPLLTSKSFGDKYSKNIITNFPLPKTDYALNQFIHMLGSDDMKSMKSIYTVLQPRLASLEMPTVEWGATFSSLKPIISALKETFCDNKRNGPESDTKKWTAQNIARVLGVPADEDKHVEGNFFFEHMIHHFIPFDESLLDHIPGILEHWFRSLKKGLSINKISFKDQNMELSFPTESGFPYVFTFEMPSLTKINILANVSNDETAANKSFPYTADIFTRMDLSHGVKIQGRSGFVTPFDNTHYMAGFDGQIQLYLPLQLETKYNLHDNHYELKMQSLKKREMYKLFQMKTIPFTTHLKLMKLDPVTKIETTKIVKGDVTPIERNLGLGILLQAETDLPTRQARQENPEKNSQKSSMLGIFSPIPFRKFAYVWSSNPREDEFVKLDITHDSIRNSSKQYGDSSSWIPDAQLPEIVDKKTDRQARREYLLNKAIESINFGKADVLDVSLELAGPTNFTIFSTVAYGTSDVDIKSRLLYYFQDYLHEYEVTELRGAIEFKSPRITDFNPGKMLKSNLSMEFDAKLSMVDMFDELLKLHGSVGRSPERQTELLEREDARNCLKEYEAGDKALIACDNITALADFYDEINVTANLEQTIVLKKLLKGISSGFGRIFRNGNLETNEVSPRHNDENRTDYSFKITRQMGLDISVFDTNMDMKVKNLRPDDVQKLVLGSDKSIEKRTRENELDEHVSGLKTPACIVGKSNMKTFDGVIYPLEMNEFWHVFFTTYPQWKPRSNNNSKLPIPYNQRTSIIGKNAPNDQREFKVNLGPDEIHFYTVDSQIKIKVNDESVEVNDEKRFQRQIEDDVAFEIFPTSNRSVALVSNEHEVKIEYDGKHLRIEASDLYYDSIGGLCGDYDGRLTYDLSDPLKLSTKDPKHFAETWSLQQGAEMLL